MSPRDDPANPDAAPESSVAHAIGEWLRSLTGRNGEVAGPESIADLLEEEMQQDLAPVERLMLLNILRIGEVRVGDVMVPRADIVAVEATVDLPGLIQVLREGFHSRVPVYRETLDEVLGFVHIKDLLAYWDNPAGFSLRSVAREVLFVPTSMRVVDLLLKMRMTRVHMAVVVDEFGGTDGLVTIEDLVEEIVGEIEDEHERAPGPLFKERPDGTIVADGRASLNELEQRLGRELLPAEREEDADTLGGLLFSLVGRVPLRGELIAHPSGLEFEVLDSDPRRVKRVRIAGIGTRPAENEPPRSTGDPLG